MNNVWLVNDQLCALGERTFWHQLLDIGLIDKTNGYTPFGSLAEKIENEAASNPPSLIVRNASYFRRINVSCPQIALVQDVLPGCSMQRDVCVNSSCVVVNSHHTRSMVDIPPSCRVELIPLGIDFELFKPSDKWVKKDFDVVFVGSSNAVKGWGFLSELIRYNPLMRFAIVTKDGATLDFHNVTNFGRVSQPELVSIYHRSRCMVCTSLQETQHLAGIEAAACHIPIIAPEVGIYPHIEEWKFGKLAKRFNVEHYTELIKKVLGTTYSQALTLRPYFRSMGYDQKTSMAKWKKLIEEFM